ncbi:unnamed protein product [Miscanthus lutarioriparius]|uniref:Uncharacterized protein n=1 Tax=Miscanthus lutarioriparius TaxID=422564 RepID=A0A811QGQ3_9POAL|nr:unnamed protein product [Miscanthus lutarioriparius]
MAGILVAGGPDGGQLRAPFHMLCCRYGAHVTYMPTLPRIFSENEKYKSMEFTTCKVQLVHGSF